MTKLAFIDSPNGTTFGDLKVGDLFTVKAGGLLMKTDNVYGNTIVVVAISPRDDYVQAGCLSTWPSTGEVIPISAITATKRI